MNTPATTARDRRTGTYFRVYVLRRRSLARTFIERMQRALFDSSRRSSSYIESSEFDLLSALDDIALSAVDLMKVCAECGADLACGEQGSTCRNFRCPAEGRLLKENDLYYSLDDLVFDAEKYAEDEFRSVTDFMKDAEPKLAAYGGRK
jgi:hypothetical protein